jgi:hypothetical protein
MLCHVYSIFGHGPPLKTAMNSRYDRITLTVGLISVALAIAALRVFNPATSNLFPPCPFYVLTGLYCPGCGSLRAIHQLLNGHGRAAFALNPLAVIALPFLGYGLASQVSLQFRGRYLPRCFIPGSWIWILGATIILFGIVRNIPLAPFSRLAPGTMLGL